MSVRWPLRKLLLGKALALATTLVGAGAAQTNIMIYTSLSDFNTVTSAQGFDTYDYLILNQFSGSPLTRSAGAF